MRRPDRVQDNLPAGLSFVSATTASGSYDPVSGLWAIGTVTAGETVTLQIVARVTQSSNITNVATIGHSDRSTRTRPTTRRRPP